MERYDYRQSVKDAVKDYILENYSAEEIKRDFETADDFEEQLCEDCWTADSVTGNASGSYFCNTWRAEEALAHNWDLIEETAQEFGIEPVIGCGYEHGAEWWDVSIRCYLLGGCISEALEEMNIEYGEE